VPEGLRGVGVDGYVLKAADPELSRATQARDADTLAAIQHELAGDPDYEGIRMAATFTLEGLPGERRLIVQRRSRGKTLYEAISPLLSPALGDYARSLPRARELFAHLIEAELHGDPIDKIFSPANLVNQDGIQLAPSPEGLAQLRRDWTTHPDLVRVRALMGQLYRLNRSRELYKANDPYRGLKGPGLSNIMPWSTGRRILPSIFRVTGVLRPQPNGIREAVNGDFGFKNFFLVRDAAGRWNIELVDY
jgi:hypothetical protein